MSSEATAIEKFRIDIPQQDLDDLAGRRLIVPGISTAPISSPLPDR
jgi:hypothetical protein